MDREALTMQNDDGRTHGDPPHDAPVPPDEPVAEPVAEAARESHPANDPPAVAARRPREPSGSSGTDARGGRNARTRSWAGFAVIVASVWALVAAYRIPPDVMTEEGSRLVESVPLLSLAYAAGAFLGIGGLIAAQKWARPARFIVGAGGLALFAGFLTLRDFTLVSALSLGLTAVVLLAAAPFVGEVPRSADAEDRAETRRGEGR